MPPRKKKAARRRAQDTREPSAGSWIERSTAAADPPTETGSQREELLNVDQAVDLLCTSRPTFYRWLRTGKLKGFKVGRQWRFRRDDLERFMRGQDPRVETVGDFRPLIEELRRQRDAMLKAAGKEPPKATTWTYSTTDRPNVQPDPPGGIEEAVNLMIEVGAVMRASDLHLEQTLAETAVEGSSRTTLQGELRCRVDGVLRRVTIFDAALTDALVARWKTLCACDIHETQRPQVGRCMIATNTVGSQMIDMRVSFVPVGRAEAVVVRMLDHLYRVPTLDQMRLSGPDQGRIETFLKQPRGMMVVSGPAGCGKTSTMMACASLLVNEQTKILTIEDPVEVRIPGMTQVQVNQDVGLTYAAGVRSLMRMDPDVLVIGELRETEVLRQALNASLTGHLVFSQAHVASAAGTLRRFLDMGADPALLGDAVALVVGQRLIRLLCCECREQQRPSESTIERARAWAGPMAGTIDFEKFYVPRGCAKCGTTGYRGRAAMVETLAMSPEIAAAVRREARAEEIEATAVRQGMTTLAADGLRRCQIGETSLEEITRVLAMG